jgi:hypothetical protein
VYKKLSLLYYLFSSFLNRVSQVAAAAVWTWAPGEPRRGRGGVLDCVVLRASDARWVSHACEGMGASSAEQKASGRKEGKQKESGSGGGGGGGGGVQGGTGGRQYGIPSACRLRSGYAAQKAAETAGKPVPPLLFLGEGAIGNCSRGGGGEYVFAVPLNGKESRQLARTLRAAAADFAYLPVFGPTFALPPGGFIEP